MPLWPIDRPVYGSLLLVPFFSGRADWLFRVIEYLRRYGYDDYQIYLLLSCAPVQGHIAGIVDIPNACTTLGLPIDIFDFDIRPEAKVVKRDLGTCAWASS